MSALASALGRKARRLPGQRDCAEFCIHQQSLPIATETQPLSLAAVGLGGDEFETRRPVRKIILQPWFKLA